MVKNLYWIVLALGWVVGLFALGCNGLGLNCSYLYIVAIVLFGVSITITLFKFFK